MPFIFAKSPRLHIDFEDVKSIHMAKGKVQSTGTFQFNLTINSVTKRIKVLVLKDFTYCLLLGVPTCRAFDFTVHFGTLTVTGQPQAAQVVHNPQLTQLFSSIKKQRPWAAPVTLADKAHGTRHLCIDYRRVNQETIPDKKTMPYIADFLEKYQVSRFFNKLDMASGYWEVAMHPEDIHKPAFITADGHFEWLVLPFGLKKAPATFQRIIRKVLGDLLNHGVLSYLDDIVIYAKTKQEHDALLKTSLRDLTITT